jgi:hypothetical protein
VEQTLAIIASMMQQAAHDATLYCAEARRTVILPRDIELALKRLVLPGSAYWSWDSLPEEAQRIRQRLFADTDASNEESDSADSWVTEIGDAEVALAACSVAVGGGMATSSPCVHQLESGGGDGQSQACNSLVPLGVRAAAVFYQWGYGGQKASTWMMRIDLT